MLYSKYYHKDTNEDPLTSSVFENLMLLPDDTFWHILRISCYSNNGMPRTAGRLIDYEFWPHWSAKGTTNNSYVEPDVFLRFELFDVIIEAKYYEHEGQYENQWRNEIKSYYNEYKDDEMDLLFIAVGGNTNMNTESIKVNKNQIDIFKTTWLSILTNVDKYKKEISFLSFSSTEVAARNRLLDNIDLAFNINGVYNLRWFNTLEEKETIISEDSINTMKQYFKVQ